MRSKAVWFVLIGLFSSREIYELNAGSIYYQVYRILRRL
jgi:hypothetical protein